MFKLRTVSFRAHGNVELRRTLLEELYKQFLGQNTSVLEYILFLAMFWLTFVICLLLMRTILSEQCWKTVFAAYIAL